MCRLQLTLPSPAMCVALLALFVAMGGSAYAAKKINAKDIRTGAVGTPSGEEPCAQRRQATIGGGAQHKLQSSAMCLAP